MFKTVLHIEESVIIPASSRQAARSACMCEMGLFCVDIYNYLVLHLLFQQSKFDIY